MRRVALLLAIFALVIGCGKSEPTPSGKGVDPSMYKKGQPPMPGAENKGDAKGDAGTPAPGKTK